MDYELIEDEVIGNSLRRTNEDGSISFIPVDESNSDYRAYLRWLNGEDEASGTLS